MTIVWWAGGLLLAFMWGGRALEAAFRMRRIPDIATGDWSAGSADPPLVTVVVPARNEQESIAQCLRSLVAQSYPNVEIIAVNDRSSDDTGSIMDQIARESNGRLRAIHLQEIPERWLGKTHAMWMAASQAKGKWLLFTDGDIFFHPETIARAVAFCEKEASDHVVIFPTPIMHGIGEHMMLAFFGVMACVAIRPWKVAEPGAREHTGFGAFNLVRRSTYEAVGTYDALRLNVIDDLSLGKRIKDHGFQQHVVFGTNLIRLRWAKGAFGIMQTLEKNFFALLHFRIGLTLAVVLATLIVNILPFLGAVIAPGWSRVPYVVAIAAIAFFYLGTARFKRTMPWCFFLHPLAAVMVAITMLNSTLHAIANRGIIWRGTKYSLRELREQLD